MQNLKQYGFTLLEILIVLVIVALMSGIVVLNVSSSTYAGFMANANKIAATLEILSDQAVYTNSVIACKVNPNGLTCQRYKNGDWEDLNVANLITWSWPENVQIKAVYVNGNLLKDGERIRFFANGDLPPMSFELSNGIYKTWIDGDLSGDFEVSN